MIKDGHYFGFEVKRPVVGIRSKLQEENRQKDPGRRRYRNVRPLAREAIMEVEEYAKEPKINT